MEWLSFALGAAAMLAVLGGLAFLDDLRLERKIRRSEESWRREREKKQKAFEERAAAQEGHQGDLFARRDQDGGAS